LDICSGYVGESLKYFEDTSAGMGYKDYYSLEAYVVYTVTVSGSPEVFYIDNSANPQLSFSANITYIFDKSDPTNAGNTLVLGTVHDSSTNLIDYQTIVGTPGQSGAYTTFTASGEIVYYYSFEAPNMGFVPPVVIKNVTNTSNMPITWNDTTTLATGSIAGDNYYSGNYTATTSHSHGTGTPSRAFNNSLWWISSETEFTKTSTGGVQHKGAWLQIDMPYKMIATSFSFYAINVNNYRDNALPRVFDLLGSNDFGVTYELAGTYTRDGNYDYINTNNHYSGEINLLNPIAKAFRTFCLVCTGESEMGWFAIALWSLIGDVTEVVEPL